MFLNDIADALTAKQIREVARKQRLDPKCWTGYHKAGTKVKGDTRVNNCVKNESDPKFGKQVLGHTKGDDEHHAVYKHPAPRKFDHYGPPHDVFINGKKWKTFPTYTEAAFVAMSLNKKGKDAHIQPALDQSSLKEFAPSPEYGGGDDGFSEETLKQLAAEWWHGDADPEVERTLNAAGWTIGQDEGNYENGGVFVVQQGDINGDSYLSWPAEELEGLAEGSSQSRLQPGTQVMLWLGPRNMLPNPPRDDKRYWDRGVVVDEPEMMTGSWQVLVKSERKGQSPISPQRDRKSTRLNSSHR